MNTERDTTFERGAPVTEEVYTTKLSGGFQSLKGGKKEKFVKRIRKGVM